MKIFLQILQLLPAILSAIVSVENVIGAGNGSTKKQLILDSVSTSGTDSQLIDLTSKLIDTVVKTLNTAHIFTKTPLLAQVKNGAE